MNFETSAEGGCSPIIISNFWRPIWVQIFTGLLFDAYVEIHQVRRLVFNNNQRCPVPLNVAYSEISRATKKWTRVWIKHFCNTFVNEHRVHWVEIQTKQRCFFLYNWFVPLLSYYWFNLHWHLGNVWCSTSDCSSRLNCSLSLFLEYISRIVCVNTLPFKYLSYYLFLFVLTTIRRVYTSDPGSSPPRAHK